MSTRVQRRVRFLLLVGTAILYSVAGDSGVRSAEGRAPDVELIGMAELPGTAIDGSGLSEDLAGTPHNRFGGISAIEYCGAGDLYYVLSDRGPNDGAVPYACRWHRVELKAVPKTSRPVAARFVDTTLMRSPDEARYVGLASAFDANDPHKDRRFDPEGIRLGLAGSLYVSDEYGPRILEFDKAGNWQRLRCRNGS